MNIVLWLKSWYLAEKPVFPPKYQRWYLYRSPQEMKTNLIYVFQGWYSVLILGCHSEDFYPVYWATLTLTQEEGYQLSHVLKNWLESAGYLWIRPHLKSRDSRIWDLIFVCQFRLRWQLHSSEHRPHRWALSPISVISDIGLSLISESPMSDWESWVRHYIGYRNEVLSYIQYPTSPQVKRSIVAEW